MAQNPVQPDLRIIQLCARLAKFAYTSGNPGSALSLRENNDQAAKTALLGVLGNEGTVLEDIAGFERYYSRSWNKDKSSQPKWFRSYAYFCHIKGQAERRNEPTIDRVIVAFRGTWNDSGASGLWMEDSRTTNASQKGCFSKTLTWIKNKMTPSSKFGLSDFYYDAILIRVPYRKGVVWKWYAYWGSLVQEMTGWAPQLFSWPRTVGKHWMISPNTSPNQSKQGHAHLGFWSLWASPEGFAGYLAEPADNSDINRVDSVIFSLREALRKTEGRKTDVYVVGHSLGGAVSSFAALDIAKELEEYSNATMYHVTFGSPPVGTADFAKYFHSQLGRHQSWNISHKRDIIPQCFSWCASKCILRRLKWWNDWSDVGVKRFITKETSQAQAVVAKGNPEIAFFEKGKLLVAGVLAFLGLGMCTLLVVPASAVGYLWRLGYYKKQKRRQMSQENWDYTYGQDEPPRVGSDVGLEFHSLQRYIDLIEADADLETSIGGISFDRTKCWRVIATSEEEDSE